LEQNNMGTPKYAEPETELTPPETPGSPSVSPEERFDEDTTDSRMSHGSPVWEIDFFETGNRLAEGFEESGKEFEIHRRTSELAGRRLP
jgi:hypothetical protein